MHRPARPLNGPLFWPLAVVISFALLPAISLASDRVSLLNTRVQIDPRIFNANGYTLSLDGRLVIGSIGESTNGDLHWQAQVFRPESLSYDAQGKPDFSRAFSPGREVKSTLMENALAFCFMSPEQPYTLAQGVAVYQSYIFDSAAQGATDYRKFRRRPSEIRISWPFTTQAEVTSFSVNTGEMEFLTTQVGTPLMGIEPTITSDGRLMIFQGSPANDGGIDYLMYAYNPNPCGVDGWSVPRPLSAMSSDPNPDIRRYPLAWKPLKAATGELFSDTPRGEHQIHGAYPWVDHEGRNVLYMAVPSTNKAGGRREAASFIGAETGWAAYNIDGSLNLARGELQLFYSSPMWNFEQERSPAQNFPPGSRNDERFLPVTKTHDVLPVIGSNTSDYNEIDLGSLNNPFLLLNLPMNELVTREGNYDCVSKAILDENKQEDLIWDCASSPDLSGHFFTGALKGTADISISNAITLPTWGSLSQPHGKGRALMTPGGGALQVEFSEPLGKLPGVGGFVQGFTVQLAIRPDLDINDGCTTGNPYRYILEKPGALDLIYEADGSVQMSFHLNGRRVRLGRSPVLPIDQWTHLAYTWDGTTGEFHEYVNGASTQRALPVEPGVFRLDTGALWIGAGSQLDEERCPAEGEGSFRGYIDEVQFYTHARSNRSVCMNTHGTACRESAISRAPTQGQFFLSHQEPACFSYGALNSMECASAMHRVCAQRGVMDAFRSSTNWWQTVHQMLSNRPPLSLFGVPASADPSSVSVACGPIENESLAVTFEELARQHPDCSGDHAAQSAACGAAAHRWCNRLGWSTGQLFELTSRPWVSCFNSGLIADVPLNDLGPGSAAGDVTCTESQLEASAWCQDHEYGAGVIQEITDTGIAQIHCFQPTTTAEWSYAPAQTSVSIEEGPHALGSTLEVKWKAPQSHPAQDWVGLFKSGAANTEYIAYKYVPAGSGGTLTFTAPSEKGIYEFRYLLKDGYTSSAVSPRFVVREKEGWSATTPMSHRRSAHTATLLQNGKVLIAGGSTSWENASPTAEIYDPSSKSWSPASSMTLARNSHTATLLTNGTVLVVGGIGNSQYVLTSEIYDPASDTWSTVASISFARVQHTATLLTDGRVLITGGPDDVYSHASAELYNPATNSWSTASPMNLARRGHTATLLPNGNVLAAGGWNFWNTPDSSMTAELYDPATNTWTSTAPLSAHRWAPAETLLPTGKVLLMGEAITSQSGNTGTTDLYDPATNSWSSTGFMSLGRSLLQAALLHSGTVLVSGGLNGYGSPGGPEYIYPVSRTSSFGDEIAPFYRVHHTTTLLPTGKVLVVGGSGPWLHPLDHLYTPPAIPGQFIAKMYSEALGRAPDQDGWQASVEQFSMQKCSVQSLKAHGSSIFTSSEFTNLEYDHASRLLALYRGALNREPDAGVFVHHHQNLVNGSVTWPHVVQKFFDSPEFQQLALTICLGEPYFWGTAAVIDLPTTGNGFEGSASQLQAELNRLPPGSTLYLKQKAVIRLTEGSILIPPGVTLATEGVSDHRLYAKMARLVREADFDAPLVVLKSGAELRGVWVDGQRSRRAYKGGDDRANVHLHGGSNTRVIQNRLSDSSGGTHLVPYGSESNHPCTSNLIQGNLITAYATRHSGQQWSDGISVKCENTTIEHNEIIDATDVGIVVFHAGNAVQRSLVRHNTILNAGNSAFGGYIADAYFGQGLTRDFTGSTFDSNLLWTSPGAHIDIALSVGGRAWYGEGADTGTGVKFINNSSGSQRVRGNNAIVVSGMLNATVSGNTVQHIRADTLVCPVGESLASVSAGWASGTLQQHYDTAVSGCMTHR